MFTTRLPPVMAMWASCGLVMTRSVLNRPCDLMSSSVCESCFLNSATICGAEITNHLTQSPRRTQRPAELIVKLLILVSIPYFVRNLAHKKVTIYLTHHENWGI